MINLIKIYFNSKSILNIVGFASIPLSCINILTSSFSDHLPILRSQTSLLVCHTTIRRNMSLCNTRYAVTHAIKSNATFYVPLWTVLSPLQSCGTVDISLGRQVFISNSFCLSSKLLTNAEISNKMNDKIGENLINPEICTDLSKFQRRTPFNQNPKNNRVIRSNIIFVFIITPSGRAEITHGWLQMKRSQS